MENLTVKFVKTNPLAIEPNYATDGSGCFDLYACTPVIKDLPDFDWGNNWGFSVYESDTAVFDTGIAFEIHPGHVMMIYSRSGHGFNHDVTLANSTGILDSDFRGSTKICLRKDINGTHKRGALRVGYGDRIAQAMIIPYPKIIFQKVQPEDLTKTERGANGFGSTGA